MIECIFANSCIFSTDFIIICLFIGLFTLVSLFFIHQYLNLTYSSYLSTFENFNNEIIINGYKPINRYLFRFYQIIYTLVMSISFSMPFNFILKLCTDGFDMFNVILLLLVTYCNLFIINIYLFKIGQLLNKNCKTFTQNDIYISDDVIRHSNLSMILIQLYHGTSALLSISLGLFVIIGVFIKNPYVAYISLVYLGLCLLTVGIRYIYDPKINNFGTYEKIICWFLYFVYTLYSLVELDVNIFLLSCLVFSVFGYEILTNNFNMTLTITNYNTETLLYQEKNNKCVYTNISMTDISKFLLKKDFFQRLWFFIKLNYLRNNVIQNILTNNNGISDTNPELFLENIYSRNDIIFK
jgi:hypothetical protein